MSLNSIIKKHLEDIIRNEFKIEPPHFFVELQGNKKYGDYSTNLPFLLSKEIQKSPPEIAEKIKELFSLGDIVNNVEVAGNGFINFFVKKDVLIKSFLEKDTYLFGKKNKKIIIDFSSPNIAKPIHAGNLRATLLGDFLSRLYEFAGYEVIRWNHLGDWGTQFGKLIVAYKKWGDRKKVEKNPIEELLSLYVKFHENLKEDAGLEDLARKEFKKLEQEDKENLELLKWFTKESLKELGELYKTLDIKFDVIKGESFYIELSKKIIKKLLDLGVATESEGAIIINLDKYNLPPALIEKSDGSTLYLTRDIASLKYRSNKYNPNEVLYITGREQSLHFDQLEAVRKEWNERVKDSKPLPKVQHIWMGLVLGPDGKKLSTREGKLIATKDIIDNFINTAEEIYKSNSGKSKSEELPAIIGIGALKFGMLKENRTSNIKLDPSKEITLKGNSSLYIQYTRARLLSVIRRAGIVNNLMSKIYEDSITEDELEIIKLVINFKDILERCEKDYSPHHLAEYLLLLSNKINAFYERKPILKAENNKQKLSRLHIIKKAANILETGLSILGIKSPDVI